MTLTDRFGAGPCPELPAAAERGKVAAMPPKHSLPLRLTVGGGIVFALLFRLSFGGPRSPFWWAELGLYALLVLLMIWRPQLSRGRGAAISVYVVCAVALGMVFELSQTVDGTGIGAVHPDTRTSFLLSFGDYLTLTIACLVALIRFGARFEGLAWFAAG